MAVPHVSHPRCHTNSRDVTVSAIDGLFGAPWERLTLTDLEMFLEREDVDDEGLVWEAKGADIRPRHIHQAVSAFGNSTLGGYLILGAERGGDPPHWMLSGSRFPTEPGLWVAQIVDGILGRPIVDVKTYAKPDDRHVVVVRIPPAAVPAVITPQGKVYQRVVGASPPVLDPMVLRDIVNRGESALVRAQEYARNMQQRLMSNPMQLAPNEQEPHVGLALSLSSAGTPADITLRMATQSFADALVEAVSRHPPAAVGYAPDLNLSQEGFLARLRGSFADDGLAIHTHRGGAVGVAWWAQEETDSFEAAVRGDRLTWAWQIAVDLVASLGGHGPAFLALYVHTRPGLHLERWTTIPLEATELEAVRRELRRGRGEAAWEPEPT